MDWNVSPKDFQKIRNKFRDNYFLSIKAQEVVFPQEHLDKISNYLINPASVGLWKFEFINCLNSGFCDYLQKELDAKLPLKTQISCGKRKFTIKDQEQKNELISNIYRLTFIECVFTYYLFKMEKKSKNG